MKNTFEKEYELRTSDFTCNNKLQPASVLDLFQTVAGEHANELGCGFDNMIDKSMLWVVIRTKFKILKDAEFFSKIRVKTWPLPPSRVSFQREYLIENQKGEPLVKGTSEWVVMHSAERRLVVTKDVYPLQKFCTEKMFEERTQKLRDFEADDTCYTLCPGFSQLDMNNHVNNTKYANYVLDACNFKDNELIEEFQIDFKHEVHADSELKILTKREENSIFAKGLNENDEIMFSCKINLK